MRAVVAYESWFGNTGALAEAVADELRVDHDVTLVSVDEPPPSLDGVDLVLVGAPTHVHGLSSKYSRRAALQQKGEEREPGLGARGWLAELPPGEGRRAAAFDTRIDKPVVLVGSAGTHAGAAALAEGLRARRAGGELLRARLRGAAGGRRARAGAAACSGARGVSA